MNSVTIPFPKTEDEFRRLYTASEFAIDVKRWLETQGLELGKDFNWEVDPGGKEITFMFEKDTTWASYIALKYLNN